MSEHNRQSEGKNHSSNHLSFLQRLRKDLLHSVLLFLDAQSLQTLSRCSKIFNDKGPNSLIATSVKRSILARHSQWLGWDTSTPSPRTTRWPENLHPSSYKNTPVYSGCKGWPWLLQYYDTPTIPVFLCMLATPSINYKLHIFEKRYQLMLQRVLGMPKNQQCFGMCSADSSGRCTSIGTLLHVTSSQQIGGGRSLITTVGTRRFRIKRQWGVDQYMVAEVEWISDSPERKFGEATATDWMEVAQFYLRYVRDAYRNIDTGRYFWDEQVRKNGPIPTDPDKFTWWVLDALPCDSAFRYRVLCTTTIAERIKKLCEMMKAFVDSRRPARERKEYNNHRYEQGRFGVDHHSEDHKMTCSAGFGGDHLDDKEACSDYSEVDDMYDDTEDEDEDEDDGGDWGQPIDSDGRVQDADPFVTPQKPMRR